MNTLDKVYDLTIDIKNIDVKYNSYAKFFDDDRETSVIRIKLLNDNYPIDLEDCTVEAEFILANNTYHDETCKIINISEGIVELQLCQECLVVGKNTVRLSILKENEIANTPVITYEVKKGLYSDNPNFNDNPLTPVLSQMLLDVKVTKANQIELQERYEKSLPKIEGKIKEVESLINRVDTAIASGTQDLEVKEARVDKNGKSYAKLGDRLDEVDSQLEQIENGVTDIVLNVKMFGVRGDGSNETQAIQNVIDNAPVGSTVLFPAGGSFKFDGLNITKSITIHSVGATLTQTSVGGNFINITSNDVKIYGGRYVLNGGNGINVGGNNNRLSSITLDRGEHAIYITGNNCVVEDCISENATYAGFKIMFSSGVKRDCVTIRNCSSINFAVKGIVFNGTVGSKKVVIKNFIGNTNTNQTASDGILIDVGNDSLICIDEVIIDNAYLYGGESNSMKLYNTNNLILKNIYARNEHSKYSSSSGLRVFAKNSYLENIDIDNRIIANEDIKINGLYFSSNATPYSIIELTGGGKKADFNNINLNVEKVSSYAIRVSRNEGIQHKITLDNYNAPTDIKIFGIFKYPPNTVGFIEIYDKKLLTNYNIASSSQNEDEIIRSPRTFVASKLPTRGTYNKGDIIYNSSLTAGGNLGWVCISPGTFGGTAPTFKAFGTLAQ